jgi:cold shock CspA family protein
MPTGVIRAFDPKRGYGFIKPDEAHKDVYFNIRNIKKTVLPFLQAKERVSYLEFHKKGWGFYAEGIRPLENESEENAPGQG